MAERKEANQKSYRRRSVSESDQDVFDLTGHKDDPRRTHRLRSVSESDHDLLDPPPPSIGVSPIQGVTNHLENRFNSQPNISSSGFIDESPWRGLGTRLQSEMRGGQDERIGDFKNQFEVLKADIANWNSSALNGTHTLDEISKKHIALCGTISERSNEALMAGLDLATCGAIANLKQLVNKIKNDAKKVLINQGTSEMNFILPHSIGNGYLFATFNW